MKKESNCLSSLQGMEKRDFQVHYILLSKNCMTMFRFDSWGLRYPPATDIRSSERDEPRPAFWGGRLCSAPIVKLQLGILRSFSTPVWTLVKHLWGLPLISGGIQPWRLAFLGSGLPIVRQTAWACPGCPCSQLCLALLSQVTLQPKFAWYQVWLPADTKPPWLQK